MCGIIGYIGEKKAAPLLIDGLLKLEYRGYDSAGISTIENGEISIIKDKGRVKNLYDSKLLPNLSGTLGIAHTRWATHGKPSKENSHPHMDNSNSFSVVHNGIIENYSEIKKFLIDNNYHFLSETDSEVIPNLIHYFYINDKKSDKQKLLRSLKNACDKLKGSYAIQLISKFEPNTIFVAKKDSPLVIGKGEKENFIASDIPAILEYTKTFYFLQDNEYGVISKNNIEFYDKNLINLNKKPEIINWDNDSVNKNGYDDFMLKEIYEQPSTVRKTIKSRISAENTLIFDDLNFDKNFLQKINKIYIIACGTAMHAGLAVKPSLEYFCKIPVFVDIASEFRYRNPIIDKNTLCIFISQSGETADTIAALKLAKSKNATTIAVTNVMKSSITREADFSIYTSAGPEIAVASTKAYTSQVTLLNILTLYFAETLEVISQDEIDNMINDLKELPNKIEISLNSANNIKEISQKIYNEKDIYFLGRGIDYVSAVEGSLKLKEISYIHSEAFYAGELKHGPIALIDNGVSVISILTDDKLIDKTISNVQEVISRGANTIVITNATIENNIFDNTIFVPKTNIFLSPILSIIPLQLFAYYIAKDKNLNVDKPRNLAKSVTVE